jgi:hypothetical protein
VPLIRAVTDLKFSGWTTQQVMLGKLRDSTKSRYAHTIPSFGEFLKTRGVSELEKINGH